MKVYVDPAHRDQTAVVVAYKGRQAIDAGAFYTPYVPLQMHLPPTERRKRARAADSRRWWRRLFG